MFEHTFNIKQLIISILALVFLGILFMALRLIALEPAILDEPEDHWRIDYIVKLRPNSSVAHGRIALPTTNSQFRIIAESFSHSQLEVSFSQNQQSLEREVFFLAPPHAISVYFEAQLDIIVEIESESPGILSKDLTPEAAVRYLRNDDTIQMDNPIVVDALSELSPQINDAEKVLANIVQYCADIKDFLREKDSLKEAAESSDIVKKKEGIQETKPSKSRVMVTLCRAAGIPARLVTGFVLTDIPLEQPHCWVEAYFDGRWHLYDPTLKEFEPYKADYLPIRPECTSLIEVSGGKDHYLKCSVNRKVPLTNTTDSGGRKLLTLLDFTNLPPKLSDAVALVLLLPLGGLIISIFSNIFGLRSYGFFIPALIGMSFVDAQWVTGIIVFVVIMCMGLGGRELLKRLNLNKMPRLSLILVLVVLSLTFTASLLDLLNIRPNPSTILFPMISLTIIIERFHKKVEGKGYREAFIKLAITLSVALCCCFLFRIDTLQWLFLTLPETEFFIAAALILVGSFKKHATKNVSSLNPPKGEVAETVTSC